MGCLLILAALFISRITLFVMWLTDFFVQAEPWETKLFPILGFLFMPISTICWGCCYVYNEGKFDGMWFLFIIVAVILDIGVNSSGSKKAS